VKARSSGKVRYIGVTGHHDPAILTEAVESWPLDAVMMPVNPMEAVLGEDSSHPRCLPRKIGGLP
jgi:predicted aldo/keto reductase-like oxidoreductase